MHRQSVRIVFLVYILIFAIDSRAAGEIENLLQRLEATTPAEGSDLFQFRNHARTFVNPGHESYQFGNFRSRAPNPALILRAMVPVYEKSVADEALLEKNEELAEKVKSRDDSGLIGRRTGMWSTYDEAMRIRVHREIRRFVYRTALDMNYQFSEFLTVLFRQTNDDREIRHTLFNSFMRRGSQPFEPLAKLMKDSHRGTQLLDRIVGQHSDAIENFFLKLESLVFEAVSDRELGEEFQGRWELLEIEAEELVQRLTLLKMGAYDSVRFANDLVRDRNSIKTFQQLQDEFADLGRGLRSSLEYLQTYKARRDSGQPTIATDLDGIQLSDTPRNLDILFGVNGPVTGRTLNYLPQTFGDDPVYEMYHHMLRAQYSIAAGAALAKLKDVQGGSLALADRLRQAVRRDSAARDLKAGGARIEAEQTLWETFIDHARPDVRAVEAKSCNQQFQPQDPPAEDT